MRDAQEIITVEMIPVDQIAVINPRIRSRKIFRQIVDSISKVGLKKPITVSRHDNGDDEAPYKLVCGQGRLEAFISLGEREIPAIVVDVTEEDSLIMSLVENLARRQHRPLELLHDIGELGKRGYSDKEIAAKTGLSYEYVHSIRHLLEEGEERLLTAVEDRTDSGQCRHRHRGSRRGRRSGSSRSCLSERSVARQEAANR